MSDHENLAEGLNNLLADAQAMSDGHYIDRTQRVQHSRSTLSQYRRELQGLFSEIKFTRECEAAVAQQLLGQLPETAQLTDGSGSAPAIPPPPPSHKPTPDDYSRVANELTRGLPRMLRRAS
jgi:hypothetical protein